MFMEPYHHPHPPFPTPPPQPPNHRPYPTPALHSWQRQDKLIMGALIGTLSPTISPLVIRAQTSHEAWTTLATTYANPSRGHILHIKDRLKHITKTTQSITEYLQSIEICTDQLSLTGKPMDHEGILQTIINGLDPVDYRPVIEAVRARDTPITFEALHEKLLHHELYAKPNQTSPLPASLPRHLLHPLVPPTTTTATTTHPHVIIPLSCQLSLIPILPSAADAHGVVSVGMS